MMKKMLVAVSILGASFMTSAFADTYVGGYYKKNGTYVQPHFRSSKDDSFSNNWSTYGNVNPRTGKRGYKRRTNEDYKYFSW